MDEFAQTGHARRGSGIAGRPAGKVRHRDAPGALPETRLLRRFLLIAAGATALWGASCSRELTITQADHINTAMYRGGSRGEPLEVNVVCVTKKDLDRPENQRLSPGSGITSDEWYARRPIPGDKPDQESRGDRFWLPSNQILLLTDDKESYGATKGVRLRGAQVDKKDHVTLKFSFPGGLHDDESVIYVFPKFIGPDGKVLGVRPAKFHPPGAYKEDLFVEIGVDANRTFENYGQTLQINDVKSPRKLHGRGE